jgi:hypothetical protein
VEEADLRTTEGGVPDNEQLTPNQCRGKCVAIGGTTKRKKKAEVTLVRCGHNCNRTRWHEDRHFCKHHASSSLDDPHGQPPITGWEPEMHIRIGQLEQVKEELIAFYGQHHQLKISVAATEPAYQGGLELPQAMVFNLSARDHPPAERRPAQPQKALSSSTRTGKDQALVNYANTLVDCVGNGCQVQQLRQFTFWCPKCRMGAGGSSHDEVQQEGHSTTSVGPLCGECRINHTKRGCKPHIWLESVDSMAPKKQAPREGDTEERLQADIVALQQRMGVGGAMIKEAAMTRPAVRAALMRGAHPPMGPTALEAESSAILDDYHSMIDRYNSVRHYQV